MDFCTIASGSSGNCIYAGSEKTGILIDAGISGKRVNEGLAQIDRSGSELAGIFITHEHIDHIQGLGVLMRKYQLPVYASHGTVRAIIGSNKLGRLDLSLFHPVEMDQDLQLGDLTIKPFSISHDAAEPCGYRVSDGRGSVAVATDMGCYDDHIVEQLQNLDAIVLESNHDVNMLQVGPYPYPLKMRILGERGHLSNEAAGHLLIDILHDNMKKIFLGHLSKENNYEALALATVTGEITSDGRTPYRADDFDICVAPRDHVSDMVTV